MTISESIIRWLRGFSGGIAATDKISIDQLPADSDVYGVFKSPGDVTTNFLGGSRDVTAYYLFITRHSSQTNEMRAANQAWMESLESWIRKQNLARNLPELGDGRTCWSVSIANSYTAQEQDDDGTVYQFSIEINYHEEAIT